MSERVSNSHWRFSMRAVLVLMVVAGVICAVVYYAGFKRREEQLKSESNNLKNLVLAMHNYAEAYKELPPAATRDGAGMPYKSWRVMVVGFIESTNFRFGYQDNQPWNSATNDGLCRQYAAPIYRAPGATNSDRACTNFVRPVGPGTIGEQALALKDITDGTSSTILLISLKPSHILWHEPRDVHLSEITRAPGNPKRILIRGKLFRGALCGLADGSVVQLPADLDYDDFTAMLTYAGGEKIDMTKFDSP